MKIEKLFFPLTVAAAVISIYLLFRNSAQTPQAFTVPNPASAGVTSGASQVQPVNYNVAPISLQPSPLTYLQDPYATNPNGGGYGGTPPYLNSNFGANDLTKTGPAPATASGDTCGCKSDCCDKNCGAGNFSGGVTPLASSRAVQVSNSSPMHYASVSENVNSYLANERGQPTPTLTSNMAAAPVSTAPTNGTPPIPTANNYAELQSYLQPSFQSSGFAFLG
jgi:hypothetical protein